VRHLELASDQLEIGVHQREAPPSHHVIHLVLVVADSPQLHVCMLCVHTASSILALYREGIETHSNTH
jgi:hypothetical protein